jgi:hypothetical protein
MKTSREHSPIVTKATFDLSACFHNMRHGGLMLLILMLSGLHLYIFVSPGFAESSLVSKNGGGRQWSVQIDKVDSGDVSPDPLLEAEIHRNLLRELAKTKKFRQVLRSDDRNGNDVPDLLILKTTMQEYAPSSETRRAAVDDVGLLGVVPRLLLRFRERTTASGATKLKVHLRLYTREGHLVLEDVVRQNVRSIGDTWRATQKLAHNMAIILKRSSLPEPATTPRRETAKTSRYQLGTIARARNAINAADADPSVTPCEVCVRVGNPAYGVLFAPTLGTDSARYETGRELLVLVGQDTITYNHRLGNALQLPILSRTSITPQNSR